MRARAARRSTTASPPPLRATRGIPRLISHLLRISLLLADERGQASIDLGIVNTATILLHLELPKPAVLPLKPRLDRDPRSRE